MHIRRLAFISSIVLLLSTVVPVTLASADGKSLVQYRKGELNIELVRDSSQENEQLALTVTPPANSKVSVFNVEKPNRVVIDLVGKGMPGVQKKLDVLGEQHLKSIRLGTHPDRLRLVLDLEGEKMPAYRWSNDDGVITLLMAKGASALPAASGNSGGSSSRSPAEPAPSGANAEAKAAEQSGDSAIDMESASTGKPLVVPAEVPQRLAKIDLRKAPKSSAAPKEMEEMMASADLEALDLAEAKSARTVPNAPESAGIDLLPADNSVNSSKVESAKIESEKLENSKSAPPAGSDSERSYDQSTPPSAAAALLKEETFVDGAPLPAVQAPETRNSLLGIRFEKDTTDNTPMIRIALSEKPQFLLLKKNNKTYRLVMPGFYVDSKKLTLPQYPPRDFKGLTLAMAEQKERGVEIRIGVDPGSRITAFANDNEIWVKPLTR